MRIALYDLNAIRKMSEYCKMLNFKATAIVKVPPKREGVAVYQETPL